MIPEICELCEGVATMAANTYKAKLPIEIDPSTQSPALVFDKRIGLCQGCADRFRR